MRNIAVKLLFSIGILTILYSTFFFYQVHSMTHKRVSEVVEQEALMALKFNLAIRKYIAKNVRPVMYKFLRRDEFMPETMSTTYVAREVFSDVQKDFPNFIIKFASDNPRNPLNKAGPEELRIIEEFNNNPHLKIWEGVLSIDGKQYVAKFSPMRMTDQCLRCHGDPKDAPVSLLKRYGSTASFHRPIGQVVGMDSIAIPVGKTTEALWSESIHTYIAGALGLLLFFLAIIFATRFMITNRLTMISKHFANGAQQEDYSNIEPIEIKGRDEISDLAFSFNTLSDKLKSFYSSLDRQVRERTRELAGKNEQLQLEIGERQKAEEQLKILVDDLDRSNTELQDFAYVVSHDLKAPLRGISSLASWISEDYAEVLDEKGQEQIEKLLTRTKRMHNLIEGILQLSRVGKVDVNFEPLQTEDIVRETIDSLSVPENINAGINGTLPSVIYDRTLLVQLFQNLVGNAVKHLDKPVGDVVVSCNDAGEFFEFCVRDNGMGIEERHFERIFKIFQSLKSRSKVESSGIGLSLVKRIVERCGGTVRVQSAVGKGSAFYFTIPKASDSVIK